MIVSRPSGKGGSGDGEKGVGIYAVFKFCSRSCEGCEKMQRMIRPCYALIERMRGRSFLQIGMVS